MKGYIRRSGERSYQLGVYLGKDTDGKKKYKWLTVKGNKRQAEAKLNEMVHQINTGVFTDPKGTFGEFIERWLVEYVKPNLSPRTLEGYQNIVRAGVGPTLGKVQLKDLKPEQLQKYYADKLATGLSTTTVRHHAMLLHCVLEFAVKWQLLVRNPADAVTPPITRHTEMHTLDETQAEQILKAAEDTPYFSLFHLALFTGMRRSELLALRWADVDLMGAEISVNRSMHRLLTHEVIFRGTKTLKSSRSVALAPDTCVVLRQHVNNEMALCVATGMVFTNERLIFCQWDGKPLLPHTISQAWRRLTHRLGIWHIRFHDLRHTHASLMLKAGIHPKIVQERLGHSSISITLDTYSHVTPGIQHAAAKTFADIFRP
jgi:integrase